MSRAIRNLQCPVKGDLAWPTLRNNSPRCEVVFTQITLSLQLLWFRPPPINLGDLLFGSLPTSRLTVTIARLSSVELFPAGKWSIAATVGGAFAGNAAAISCPFVTLATSSPRGSVQIVDSSLSAKLSNCCTKKAKFGKWTTDDFCAS